jgi:hypothetical protein
VHRLEAASDVEEKRLAANGFREWAKAESLLEE